MPPSLPAYNLDGKVAVVTGAGRGIGKAIAVAYAQAGAAVCCAARTGSEIAETVQCIRQRGGRALDVVTDVTDLAAVTALFDAADAAFGGIDIVVLNAGGYLDDKPVADGDPSLWRATLDLNLMGTYYCAHAAIPHLKRRGGGKIITLGSGLGHRGRMGSSAYACAKAGVWMLTRVLAQELWPDNISVNELIPGPVRTDMNARSASSAGTSLGESEWVKTPEEVVPLALFLATLPEVGPTAQSFSLMRRDN